jgi:hypothetical protein
MTVQHAGREAREVGGTPRGQFCAALDGLSAEGQSPGPRGAIPRGV